MKNLLFLLTAIIGLTLFTTSCNKDNDTNITEDLSQQIENAQNKTSVNPSDLPNSITTTVDEKHFETYIDAALLAKELGYKVALGNGQNMYFNLSGVELQGPEGNGQAHGPHGGGPHGGPCGCGPHMGGTPVNIADLPASLTDYVDANYVNAEIKRARNNPAGAFIILVKFDNGRAVLKFDADGNFVEEITPSHHGCGGTPVNITDLPVSITDYVNTNYVNAEIKRAKNNPAGEYIVLVKFDNGRAVLKFDTDGNFIEEISPIHHGCGNITPLNIADLPTIITDYITTNYPDAEIMKAGQKTNSGHYGVVLNTNGDRTILIFDGDGNFLFERG